MCIEAPESTTNYLSIGFVEDGAGRHQTDIWKGEECSFVLSKLENIMPIPTHLCGRIALDFLRLFLRSVLKFRCIMTTLERTRWAEPHLATDPFFPESFTVRNAPLNIAHCAWVPRIVCQPVKSTWISASLHPGTHSLTAWKSSTRQQNYYYFSAVCVADCQLLCAYKSTSHRTRSPNRFCKSDTGEDAMNHTRSSCISRWCGLCTVPDISSETEASERLFIRSMRFCGRMSALIFQICSHRGDTENVSFCTVLSLSIGSTLLAVLPFAFRCSCLDAAFRASKRSGSDLLIPNLFTVFNSWWLGCELCLTSCSYYAAIQFRVDQTPRMRISQCKLSRTSSVSTGWIDHKTQSHLSKPWTIVAKLRFTE